MSLNGQLRILDCQPGETLLGALRRAGLWSVKHGCETGECGACAVLIDGALMPTCVLLAGQAAGRQVVTLECLAPGQSLHPLQQAFIEVGAIQCGYCSPAMILAAQALLAGNPRPSESDVREALSGVLCRCTGYKKPIEAVLRAAAALRGEPVPPIGGGGVPFEAVFGHGRDGGRTPADLAAPGGGPSGIRTRPIVAFPVTRMSPQPETDVVGHREPKVDAVKLAKGRAVFAGDVELPGMLHAALLTSPHAHARIRHIDASRARALPGVHAVLTHQDIPRVVYASGGQSFPNPPPYDQVSLDNKVRYAGDRVAVVAAETPEIAREALGLIDVGYEPLPAVFDPLQAMQPGAPRIHDEPDAVEILDANRNLVAQVHASVGDLERGLAESDRIFERRYYSQQVQQASIEPHVVITYWDEDDRLVVRTSTQVPFHVRRMLAPLLGLPVKRIRVIKPRIGGGFGGKQEMLIEDLCGHLTLATGRPVRFEYTREMEFTSARSRHPQWITYRAGVQADGTLNALEMCIVEDCGAYGTHGLTVCSVSGLRGLSTYRCPNMRLHADIVYTNKPVPGAFRGYGAPQALWALESLVDEVAAEMGFDPVEFRLRNAVRAGDPLALAKALGEGREGFEQIIQSCGLPDCAAQGAAAIGWDRRADPGWRRDPARPHLRRGLGMAVCMHGTAIAGLDMGAASIKMNDDGSFNLLVGATDLGTGSDTVLAQIAAETLGCLLADVVTYSSDTDLTPFDTGAYASSTTYISGGAVMKAAEQVREKIFARVALMLGVSGSAQQPSAAGMYLRNRSVWLPDGRSVSLEAVALHSLHTFDQEQIMATASHMSYHSPPPFAAQFAEVEVDTETGQVTVTRLVMAVDCGTAINPQTVEGQVEGGLVQALGYAVSEEMAYDQAGCLLTRRFGDYRVFQADEAPELQAILAPSYEPSGPFGAKAVAEIPMDGVAPAVANAVFDAVGVRLRSLPLTPEKVWLALKQAAVG
ncbi:MAG: molybdopterin-dependent oxidoreductase [Anaerolineales bacterium]|nr:molybdopterin-dependent oxidoreductase [Anaerolineales bacterium]